jgi:hypothetical protein
LLIFLVNINFINFVFLGILAKIVIFNLALTFRRSIFVVRIIISVLGNLRIILGKNSFIIFFEFAIKSLCVL